MKEKVNLKFACSVPWNEMLNSGDKERFCKACQKHVRDFTSAERLDTTGVECGRFSSDQIGSISRNLNFGKGALATFSIAALIGLSTLTVTAQTQPDKDTVRNEIFKGGYYLSGTVRDEKTGEALPFVNIIIKTKQGAIVTGGTTDFDGHFEILLSADDLNQRDLIAEIRFTGYQKTVLESLEFDPKTSNKIIEACLKPAEEQLEEVTIEYITMGLIVPNPSPTDSSSSHKSPQH
ncbi:MAG: carboxypeptidase-like regulatory domain-containing protein [Owenweeksia sp.]